MQQLCECNSTVFCPARSCAECYVVITKRILDPCRKRACSTQDYAHQKANRSGKFDVAPGRRMSSILGTSTVPNNATYQDTLPCQIRTEHTVDCSAAEGLHCVQASLICRPDSSELIMVLTNAR